MFADNIDNKGADVALKMENYSKALAFETSKKQSFLEKLMSLKEPEPVDIKELEIQTHKIAKLSMLMEKDTSEQYESFLRLEERFNQLKEPEPDSTVYLRPLSEGIGFE